MYRGAAKAAKTAYESVSSPAARAPAFFKTLIPNCIQRHHPEGATQQSTMKPPAGHPRTGSEHVKESADLANKVGAKISDSVLPVAQARPAFPAGFELAVEITLQFFEEALPAGLVLVLQHIFKERDNFSQLILGQISPGSQIV